MERWAGFTIVSTGTFGSSPGGGGSVDRVSSTTYNEADGEERTALEDAAGHVAAVVALADDALVALELLAKRLLAADEEEEHGGGIFGVVRGSDVVLESGTARKSWFSSSAMLLRSSVTKTTMAGEALIAGRECLLGRFRVIREKEE